MWKHEVEQNPWRYDENLFISIPVEHEEKRRMASIEIESAESQLKLYRNNYTAFQDFSMRGMSSYIEMNMVLYKNLINQMNKRLEVAKYVLKNT